MAVLRIPEKSAVFKEPSDIARQLAYIGIDYERWENIGEIGPEASDDEILEFYAAEINALKAKGGYVTADVINIVPTTPKLDEMLDKFNKEHWHDEDEVRFIVKGRGLFHIAADNGEVAAIEMEAGDLIRVPRGTRHWFDLCGERTVRAIRLFQDVSGWTPQYTGSGRDSEFQPTCFGVSYFPQAG